MIPVLSAGPRAAGRRAHSARTHRGSVACFVYNLISARNECAGRGGAGALHTISGFDRFTQRPRRAALGCKPCKHRSFCAGVFPPAAAARAPSDADPDDATAPEKKTLSRARDPRISVAPVGSYSVSCGEIEVSDGALRPCGPAGRAPEGGGRAALGLSRHGPAAFRTPLSGWVRPWVQPSGSPAAAQPFEAPWPHRRGHRTCPPQCRVTATD